MPLRIWTNVQLEYPRKEDLIADPEAAAAWEAKWKAQVAAATVPVVTAIRAKGGSIELDGVVSPLIRATVDLADVEDIERLVQVSTIDYQDDTKPATLCDASINNCYNWITSSHVTSAHSYSTGTGQKVCVMEADRPDDTSHLSVAAYAVPAPNGTTNSHVRHSAGMIKSTDGVGYQMAPDSSIYIANWSGYSGSGGVDKWCMDNGARTVNLSWSGNPVQAYQSADDWHKDWMAKVSPYTLWVPAAGNCGSDPTYQYVQHRVYNGLVTGGVDDNDTATLTDDVYDPWTNWRNPLSTHGDWELPHVLAQSWRVSAVGVTSGGSSDAAPQAAGLSALVGAVHPASFDYWPEMRRAVIMATATERVGDTALSSLPFTGDVHSAAGRLNALQAVLLADSANLRDPGTTAANRGRWASTVQFSGFDSNGFYAGSWNVGALATGRLRVVIAWDGSATCDSLGWNCTGELLDADLDLWVYSASTGYTKCSSVSYDNSFEICDFAVTSGETYTIKVKKVSTNATNTYLGLAWNNN